VIGPLPLGFLRRRQRAINRGDRARRDRDRQRAQQQPLRPRSLEEVMPPPARRLLGGDQAPGDPRAVGAAFISAEKSASASSY
jgi:hypothetical protein